MEDEAIPDDLRNAAWEVTQNIAVMSLHEQRAELIAAALLAERLAERERCAKIAGFSRGDCFDIAYSIRAQR